MSAPRRQTLDDLMRVKGKAELVGGEIIVYPPRGVLPSQIAWGIARSLDEYATEVHTGEAFGGSLGYALPAPLPSGRESFCPDASYHAGPFPTDPMKFIPAAPTFAVEVRGLDDYGPVADRTRVDKRKDYFFAGTLVVWDVDPRAKTVAFYRASDPTVPVVFGPGDTADAEPAVPGWRLKVDELFV